MAPQSLFVCSNCGKQHRIIPLKNVVPAQPGNTFENISQSPFEPTEYIEHATIEKRNFWASDGATYALAGVYAGGALAFVAWWYELDIGPIVAGGALVVGVGLHVLKIWLHRPERTSQPAAETTHTIKVESWDNERGQVILQEIQDDRITLDILRKVAVATITDGENFSRPALTKSAGISQSKYHVIKDEFERLNFCYTDKGNKTHLLRSGKAFLRQVLESTP